MAYTPADPVIIAALTVGIPAENASAQINALYAKLQEKIEVYELAVAESLSSEGINRTLNVEAAAKQVGEYLAAYQQVTAATGLPAATDPVLLQNPLGHTVDHSYQPMRF